MAESLRERNKIMESAEDDDTTNVDKPNRLNSGQFDKKIKLVGNK